MATLTRPTGRTSRRHAHRPAARYRPANVPRATTRRPPQRLTAPTAAQPPVASAATRPQPAVRVPRVGRRVGRLVRRTFALAALLAVAVLAADTPSAPPTPATRTPSSTDVASTTPANTTAANAFPAWCATQLIGPGCPSVPTGAATEVGAPMKN